MTSTLVLAGLGHTHALVLANLARRPGAGVGPITCITPHSTLGYSGMLPGVLAGQYDARVMEIDARALCLRAGVGLVPGSVRELDISSRRVVLDDGSWLPYDVLSFNLGSGPPADLPIGAAPVHVAVRPAATFLSRLRRALAAIPPRRNTFRLAVVGAGLGGIELALTLPTWLEQQIPNPVRVTTALVTRDDRIAPTTLAGTRARLERVLTRRQVTVEPGVAGDQLGADDADLVVWATGAAPVDAVVRFGLERDPHGFIVVDETLQTSAPGVFACGDTASLVPSAGHAPAKAGVYAVRQAPVLAANLLAALQGRRERRRYVPQASFMRLINTGDGRAIGEWRNRSFEGAWVWRLKDAIDRRFMRRLGTRA